MLTEEERRMMASLNDRIQRERDHAELIRLVEQLNKLLANAKDRTVSRRNSQS